MRALATCLAVLGMAGVVYATRAADAGSRPPGIEAHNWYRISDRLGFVVVQGDGGFGFDEGQTLRAAPENVGADLLAPLKGYFVVQTSSGWRTIVMTDPVAFSK
jgi:hypothetical protein